MTDLALRYAEVGAAAREWDEQHVHLAAAAGAVADLPVGCLTPRVAAVAGAFCHRWAGYLDDAGRGAEARADGIRDSLREVLDADEVAGLGALLLRRMLVEVR